MVGEPIEQVQQGMRTIIQNLRVDPYALETVFVSIIAFAGKARMISPLTELYKFYPPTFPIGGGTSLGTGLEAVMDDIDKSVIKSTAEQKGDWKPVIFLFTDGNPTDNYQAAFRRWNRKYRKRCNLVAVSIGDNVNVLTLAQITDDILLLKETDPESFSRFFKWISASIQTTSMAVNDGNDEVKLAPTTGINLEKVDTTAANAKDLTDNGSADENFVVLHGRCQNTGRDYLAKYSNVEFGDMKSHGYRQTGYRLVGAYPVDNETYASLSDGRQASINTIELTGVPTCPCCGNQLGVVVCECGRIFCVGNSRSNKCPWCGMVGELGNGGPGGMDITRGLG